MEPDQSFTRYGADLRVDLNITLAEALTGFTRDFQLLNGSIILLNQTGVRGGNSTGLEKFPNSRNNSKVKPHGLVMPRTTSSSTVM